MGMEEQQNVVDLKESSSEQIDAWNSCIKTAIFSDLITLRELEPDVFKELFYGRTNALPEFTEALQNVINTGANFIVLGDAGVGKSTFLYKIFLNEENELEKYIYPIFLDFRKGSISIEAALVNFIDKVDDYFTEINIPINTLEKPKEKETIAYNLIKISEHLSKIPPDSIKKKLLLLVDDLDYADDFWMEFLLSLHNLVLSPKLSFVLSLRPLLLFQIRSTNDVLYRDIIRSSVEINLSELSVSKILNKRLAPIIKENEANPFHLYIKRLFRRDSALCRILRKQYKITTMEDLARFQFPFTSKLMIFMSQITNGNVREVFDIAEATLRYIFKNATKLDTRIENGDVKYILPHSIIIELFHSNAEKYKSNYLLFDLNEDISDKNNSLHFNVLEAVKYSGIINNRVLVALEQMGHNKEKVNSSLSILEDRTHRLITPIISNKLLKGNRKVVTETEYKITRKGEKYLEMSTIWESYKKEFGDVGESVKRLL